MLVLKKEASAPSQIFTSFFHPNSTNAIIPTVKIFARLTAGKILEAA
jgi:hypothetical protein